MIVSCGHEVDVSDRHSVGDLDVCPACCARCAAEAAAARVVELSVQVMERTGGLDITSTCQVAELRKLEAEWGEAVRAYMEAVAHG